MKPVDLHENGQGNLIDRVESSINNDTELGMSQKIPSDFGVSDLDNNDDLIHLVVVVNCDSMSPLAHVFNLADWSFILIAQT